MVIVRRADTRTTETMNAEQSEAKLGTFEKYLVLWIPLCMVVGGVLSRYTTIGDSIEALSIRGISIPIGLCLFFMMYPAVLNLKGSELRKLKQTPKPILLTFFSNWLLAPLVGFGLAKIFLSDHEELFVAVILLTVRLLWNMGAFRGEPQSDDGAASLPPVEDSANDGSETEGGVR